MSSNTKDLTSVFSSGDGAHCGLTDWYEDKEAALKAALENGKPFDTGWYSSKKEIASARISSDGQLVFIRVSVSDDFDTEGVGEATIPAPASLEEVARAVDRAWEEAEGDQKSNRQYAGYSLIHHTTRMPEWCRAKNIYPRETRKRYPKKVPQCLDYYIVPAGDYDYSVPPPGDSYTFWGWQNDVEGEGAHCVEEGIPPSAVAKFEEFATQLESGSLRIGDWEIKAWDKDEHEGDAT